MGQVYRADDLELSQTVALKFLPEELAADPDWVTRLRGEVRISRQIAHPNVVRVFDIAQDGDRTFVTMEFVDGEDLATTLRRMGRPTQEKALEWARQICAGVAASHELNVLHRDLKPANILIDGKGRARVADFGLAAAMTDVEGKREIAGTPAYMAPEQLSRGEVSVQSDLYSLGLILYELFTGKPAIPATSIEEIKSHHSVGSSVIAPTSLVEDLDPVIEAAIQRCIDPDPSMRPKSALAVAASLPGGDPLAAALAAGETPSPELVAAAGKAGFAKARTAGVLMGVIALMLAMIALYSDVLWLTYRTPLPRSPSTLLETARETIRRFEAPSTATIENSGIEVDREMLIDIRRDVDARYWDSIYASGRPSPVRFWYLHTREPVVPTAVEMLIKRFAPIDREMVAPGSTLVKLDPQGRLTSFLTTPPAIQPPVGAPRPTTVANEAEVDLVLSMMGVSREGLTEAIPVRNFPVAFDQRFAFQQMLKSGNQDWPVRIEIAMLRGRVVAAEMMFNWQLRKLRGTDVLVETVLARRINVAMAVTVTLGVLGIAWLNLRRGRGDRRGAIRLAYATVMLHLLWWLVAASHLPGEVSSVIDSFLSNVIYAVFAGVSAWVLYIALEPVIRRRWPWQIVSWTRLIAGKWSDALVGRDVLIGTTVGVAVAMMITVAEVRFANWFSLPQRPPQWEGIETIASMRDTFGFMLAFVQVAICLTFAAVVVPIVLQWVVRSKFVAQALFAAAVTLAYWLPRADGILWALGIIGATATIAMIVLNYFGVLALVAMLFSFYMLAYLPGTFPWTEWHATPAAAAFCVILIMAILSAYSSIGGRDTVRRMLARIG